MIHYFLPFLFLYLGLIPLSTRLTISSSFAGIVLPPQHFCQTGQTATISHKIVLKKFIRRRSALDINAEADTEECLELPAKLVWILQTRGSIGGNEEQCLEKCC